MCGQDTKSVYQLRTNRCPQCQCLENESSVRTPIAIHTLALSVAPSISLAFHCSIYHYCYTCATENLRCRSYSVFGSVCPWVSLCVLKTLWTPQYQKPMVGGISSNFGHRCTWIHGCAGRISGGQKDKSKTRFSGRTAGNNPKNLWTKCL